jgi:selenocysteine-specific elongation factor
MTIDLGFAHLDLPSGRRVGIVDVPGHERLIKNMLAGAGGLDMVLLVVAADEGVMPQTREHLDILRFLRLHQGIVVLTKIDLVSDLDWIALVEEDVRGLAAGTFLDGAPVVRVSARSGEGLERLVVEVDRLLDSIPARTVDGPVRLPVDRVFTMAGFGTVVTGTLWSGRIRPGDLLEVLPRRAQVRVRQVERHGERSQEVTAGSRTALNLVEIPREALERGMVLATPGTFQPTTLLDVRARTLPGAPPLAHLARLRFYLGTDEALCRIALLDRDRLRPGEEAPAQLRLEEPVVAARGDPFVLRRYSPLATLGGGEVIAVNPPRRRRGATAAADVAALAEADLGELVRAAIAERGLGGASLEALTPAVAERRERVAAEVARLVEQGRVLQIQDRLFDAGVVERAAEGMTRILQEVHHLARWRLGLPREEVKNQAFSDGDDRLFTVVLERLTQTGIVGVTRGFLHLAAHRSIYGPEEDKLRAAIAQAFTAGRFAPPTPDEVAALLRGGPAFQRMVQSLQEEGRLVEVAPGMLFAADVLVEIERLVIAHIEATGEMTVAQLRDALGTSRKFALALMEYFDGIRLTRRVGDRRLLATSRRPAQSTSS